MMSERGAAKTWILGFLIAFPAGLAGLVGIGCALDANTCPFTDDPGITATAGDEIWIAACAVCHGETGDGSPNPRAPSLISGPSAELTLERLLDRIGRGSLGLMPRFKSTQGGLSDEQIEAVARYVLELRGETPDE